MRQKIGTVVKPVPRILFLMDHNPVQYLPPKYIGIFFPHPPKGWLYPTYFYCANKAKQFIAMMQYLHTGIFLNCNCSIGSKYILHFVLRHRSERPWLGPFLMIWILLGPDWTLYFNGTIWDHFGSFGPIGDNLGRFRVIWDHRVW